MTDDPTTISGAILTEAEAAGMIDAGDALELIDFSTIHAEGGKAHGAREAISALKQAKPYLFNKPDARDMSPEERLRLLREIKRHHDVKVEQAMQRKQLETLKKQQAEYIKRRDRGDFRI